MVRPIAAVDTASSISRYSDLTFLEKTYENGYNNYSIAVSPNSFKNDWRLVNTTPRICDLKADGSSVDRLASGNGIIELVWGDWTRKIRLPFHAGVNINHIWDGFESTSVSSTLSSSIKNQLVDGGDLNYYTGFVNGHVTATKNPNCWLASIDLSGCALATDLFVPTWTTANSGFLITPQHWVGVAHWLNGAPQNMGPGRSLKFVSAAGTVYTRTVVSRILSPDSRDLILCTLNAPLPADIKPLPIAGNWILDPTNKRIMGMGFQIHQDKRLTVAAFDRFADHMDGFWTRAASYGDIYLSNNIGTIAWDNMLYWQSDPDHWLYGFSAYTSSPAIGDSGGLIGGISHGNPFAVSMFTGYSYGGFFYEGSASIYNAAIVDADAAAGVSTGYTVTIAPNPL